MEAPSLSVYLDLPSRTLLQLPDRLPDILPDIRQNATNGKWPSNPKFYNYTLDIRFPFLWAALYMAAVLILNRTNRRRKNKPWAVSKLQAYRAFVLFHNVLLALLSAWALLSTCQVMWRQAPANDEPNYLVHVVDRLCRTEEVLGIESIANFSPWNNDLSHIDEVWYISWVFYMLKFYEVIDTVIILASGKESSILQTYHHAGVMICAWASLRFVSPAAFFVLLLNSAIHTIMYTYFALTAIRIRLPIIIKRTLTTLQMVQFLVGLLSGFSYLFIKYDIPSPNFMEQQLSPLVIRPDGTLRSGSLQHGKAYRTIPCLSNSGQAFVFWLGAAYVIPLMYMFGRFYVKAYAQPAKEKLS